VARLGSVLSFLWSLLPSAGRIVRIIFVRLCIVRRLILWTMRQARSGCCRISVWRLSARVKRMKTNELRQFMAKFKDFLLFAEDHQIPSVV
jgi:hypothetical protein